VLSDSLPGRDNLPEDVLSSLNEVNEQWPVYDSIAWHTILDTTCVIDVVNIEIGQDLTFC
jgi:hypothetical protein